jgi:hypothetical protein
MSSRSTNDDNAPAQPLQLRSALFPGKLHQLLQDAAKEGYDDVISWLPDGKSFQVHDTIKFADQIMPRYFGSSKYRSFQKNLNLWQFKTIALEPSPGRGRGECWHRLFVRGNAALCEPMKRVVKSRSRRQPTIKKSQTASMTNESLETLTRFPDEDGSLVKHIRTAKDKKTRISKEEPTEVTSSPHTSICAANDAFKDLMSPERACLLSANLPPFSESSLLLPRGRHPRQPHFREEEIVTNFSSFHYPSVQQYQGGRNPSGQLQKLAQAQLQSQTMTMHMHGELSQTLRVLLDQLSSRDREPPRPGVSYDISRMLCGRK